MASYYARKSTSLRAAKRWLIDEMDTMEALATMHRMRPIDTKAARAGRVFSVSYDRCDLTRESVAATARTQDPTELLFVDLHADEDAMSDLADEEDWSEVAAINNGTDAWVVIKDDWEVVDKNGEKVRTFADVLQMAPVATPSVAATSRKLRPALLSRLSVMEHTATPSCSKTLRKMESDLALPAYELERGVKSFGARKRHMAKHHH
ncbi:unnamed protein product [Peronospora destructor]|uniref:Uncharacterized protein n=1 Tax=Peronospora destructor TaxID=86335 RepID=A0AAV0UNU5_9STRA|nr:unnamed protein product [Peronospora destructor]